LVLIAAIEFWLCNNYLILVLGSNFGTGQQRIAATILKKKLPHTIVGRIALVCANFWYFCTLWAIF